MINTLLDIFNPERSVERHSETFKRGLIRLLEPRASDHDPINCTKPRAPRASDETAR